jgi:hypothetical protein
MLKVTLRDVRPAAWRRLEVPSAFALGELHEVLQVAFGWDDGHLRNFEVRGVRFTREDREQFGSSWLREPARNEDVPQLARVAPRTGDVLDDTCDVGDEWRDRIEVEKVARSPGRPDARTPGRPDARTPGRPDYPLPGDEPIPGDESAAGDKGDRQ